MSDAKPSSVRKRQIAEQRLHSEVSPFPEASAAGQIK
jgi:hypothetical protein